MFDGLLLIDKPSGLTSHDVVDAVRRRLGIRRVGHGGTLDPAATGLLILLIGPATRRADFLLTAEKTYRATLRLGVATDTQDAQGRITATREVSPISRQQLEETFARFVGQIEQEIPAYSAVWIQGRRSYELARAGVAIPPRSRRVNIRELTVLDVRLPDVEFEVICSKGTYVRTLCVDLGNALGCGGHLSRLRRTRIGPYTIEQAVKLEEARPEHIIPIP